MKRVVVIGVGNFILKDEGVGIHVINHLAEMDLPAEVELVDGGTHSYDLLDFLCQGDVVIVIDAMQAGGEPGTIYRAPLDELGLQVHDAGVSLHEMNVAEAVDMVRKLGHNPEVIVFGIEPKEIDWGLEPTPELAAKIPRVAELVKQEIQAIIGRA